MIFIIQTIQFCFFFDKSIILLYINKSCTMWTRIFCEIPHCLISFHIPSNVVFMSASIANVFHIDWLQFVLTALALLETGLLADMLDLSVIFVGVVCVCAHISSTELYPSIMHIKEAGNEATPAWSRLESFVGRRSQWTGIERFSARWDVTAV